MLGEGLHPEYIRRRRADDPTIDTAVTKVELHTLVCSGGVLTKVASIADAQQIRWTGSYKAKVSAINAEKLKQAWRDLEASGNQPELTVVDPPQVIEAKKATNVWRDHLFVEDDGEYREDFTSSWESRALKTELDRSDVVGWIRNRDRQQWSLCAKRLDGTVWRGVYPDFITFRETAGGIIPDIIDPHLLSDENAPSRARALAQFAADHHGSFGRIEMIIYADKNDPAGKRIDLCVEQTRQDVASVTTPEHLRSLYQKA